MTDPASPTPATIADEHDSSCLPVGLRLGEFEIKGLIGVGGFGIVYSAWDHLLEREVALKEYMPSALATRSADNQVAVKSERHQETFAMGLRSFVNEARLLAQFDHPSLVKVYRFWEANGTAYMVMPFYKGSTLRAALKNLGEAPQEAVVLQMLRPLLDALDVIHAANCYHRDIAPDNILILQSGQPVLLDFGAARRVIGDFTQALTVILKPGFAPVEQYANGPEMRQGPWTDIYALAAVIYYCIGGKTPTPSVSRMMRDTMVPASELGRGKYSAGFLAAIDRGLAVRIEDRTASITQLRADLGLEEIQESSPLTVLGGAPGADTGLSIAAESARRDANPPMTRSLVTTAIESAPIESPAPSIPDKTLGETSTEGAAAASPLDHSSAPPTWAAAEVGFAGPSTETRTAPAHNIRGRERKRPAFTWVALAGAVVAVGAGVWLTLGRTPSPDPAAGPVSAETPAASNRLPNPAPPTATPAFSPQAVLDSLFDQRDPDWQVAVTLRSDTLKINDQSDILQFRVRSARAGNLYVWQVGTNATDFWQLFPNAKDRNNRIEADRELVLPRKIGAVYAAGPPGVSRLIAFVTPSARDFKLTGLHASRTGEPVDEFDLDVARSLWQRDGPVAFAGKPLDCSLGDAACASYGAARFDVREVN